MGRQPGEEVTKRNHVDAVDAGVAFRAGRHHVQRGELPLPLLGHLGLQSPKAHGRLLDIGCAAELDLEGAPATIAEFDSRVDLEPGIFPVVVEGPAKRGCA